MATSSSSRHITAARGNHPEGLPSRLTPADHQAIENRVAAIGLPLLERARAIRPSAASSEWWLEQAGEWATHDDDLKVRLFRLIDCMPMLNDAAAIDRHLREYFDDGLMTRLPPLQRTALQAARSGLIAPLAAQAVRLATHLQARRFIAGTTPAEVARAARSERRHRRGFTLDHLGEAVTSEAEAENYLAAMTELVEELPPAAARWPFEPLVDDGPDGPLPRVNLSIKLSALDSRFDAIDPVGTSHRVLERLRPLCRLARGRDVQIHVDMEHHAVKDLTFDIFRQLADEPEFRDWPNLGIVVQCYLRESRRDLTALADWAARRGAPIWVRLVKGAYWDAETIHAQAAGWPVPVFAEKWETDRCYEEATCFLLEQSAHLRPALGSHNLRSLAHGMAVAEHLQLDRRLLEVQMLYGMADAEKAALSEAGWRVRVYMPYGQLVPGMAYLVRRLLENASNESFLRAGFVERQAPERLFAAPTPPVMTRSDTPAPLPASVFRNEPLLDFSQAASRQALQQAITTRARQFDDAGPTPVPIVIGGCASFGRDSFPRHDPSRVSRQIAVVTAATPEDAVRAVDTARDALPIWSGLSADRRIAIVRHVADLMRQRRCELTATQIFEVGKPWREADADVAEAIDFCEYYAAAAERLAAGHVVTIPGEENHTQSQPRGVTVVIAPWNFPLAILTGMTTAALVTGNTVVMKPAEQASLVAAGLHQLLLEAGVPPEAVALLPGRGEELGPALVTHPDTATIAFTGSRAVGLAINAQAAAASAQNGWVVKRVIAEMGGKNPIIIDDDADLDEAVLGVVQSSFSFAGQKCSACSRVIVLDRVYAAFLRRLGPAVASLQIGPADQPGSRIGPVVDRDAQTRICRFIDAGRKMARELVSVDVGRLASEGCFVGPTVFTEVDPASPLGQEEIFGPVLTVFRAADFEDALRLANATPYALTAGIYSRSPVRLRVAREKLVAGNLYLNRCITGAAVWRQPFGGFRLSGTGGKAGGPDTLGQFTQQRTIAENTVRRGFAPAPHHNLTAKQ